MVRKTRKQMVQRIIQLLGNKPMTVNEISLAVGSNWDTVYKALNLLESINIVTETGQGNKKVFQKVDDCNIPKREDTLLGLPVSGPCEDLCHFLFLKVKEKWVRKTKHVPNRTQMQKVVGEIADQVKLPCEIPRGWYLFGQVCILEYDPNQEYQSEFKNRIPGLEKEIDKAIEIYSKYDKMADVLFEQYRRKKKILYMARLKLKQIICYELNKNTEGLISKLLNALVMNFPETEDNKPIVQLLNAYVSIVNRIFVELDQPGNLQDLIIDCFSSLWELMATYNLFSDLANGNYGYKKETLAKYFDQRFDTLIVLCRDYLEELNSHLPLKKIDEDSKLFKLIGSAKPKILTNEEKEKLFENYEEKDISDRFGKFNLN